MSRPRDITKKLREADPELSMYIVELEKENLRLHKKIAKLQIENTTKDNKIKALKNAQPRVELVIGFKSPSQIVPPTLPGAPEENPSGPPAASKRQ
jgi:hypothetical protein